MPPDIHPLPLDVDSALFNHVLVTGGHGFIGSHVAHELLRLSVRVRIVDIAPQPALLRGQDYEFMHRDLCDPVTCQLAVRGVTSIFHFAATMGGMGMIHEENDLPIYITNHFMTLHLLSACMNSDVKRIFYASSACVYPDHLQYDSSRDVLLREQDVWEDLPGLPVPQGLYGLEKLDTELILHHLSSKLDVRVARFHNVYGPGGAWNNGREKAPAALLRKACALKFTKTNPLTLEIWGDGKQRRSFLWIGDAVNAVLRLFTSNTVKGPVNIGSENSVTIKELAELALAVYGIDKARVTFDYLLDKPVGVASRNSDNTYIRSQLKWEPMTSIAAGMSQTGKWVEMEIKRILASSDEYDHLRILEDLQQSQIVRLDIDTIDFAIILPITSRGSPQPETCLENLARFASSFARTTLSDTRTMGETRFRAKIYLAIDHDDSFLLLQDKNGTTKAEDILEREGLANVKIICNQPRGHVCSIWRECARKAWRDGCDYLVLMGDDVILHDEGWMRDIHSEFQKLAEIRRVPFGFGCVAFKDLSFPGMPTFPVLHRTHMDIFNGVVVPEKFINQDGDPFLFQLYRRWGCSVMLSCSLSNGVGGSEEARYTKQPATGWTFETLDKSVESVAQWLESKQSGAQKLLTMDVVIPCYRVDLAILRKILSLQPSNTCSIMFVIIIDDPVSPHAADLENEYGHRPDVRIRRNAVNIGASGSRNRGMDESAAEWNIFLDDDVLPNQDLLVEAEKAIREHPTAAGFVGNSLFPQSQSIFTTAVRIAGVTFFWDIATKIKEDVPWGVTANLIARRNVLDGIRFNTSYPKTGGGEDIEFCRRKRDFFFTNVDNGKGFVGAPSVIVTRPWWNNGARSYRRFYMWSYGDGALVKRYPDLSYWDYCFNSTELLLLSTALLLVLPFVLPLRTSTTLVLGMIVSITMANIIHDCYRHLWRDAERHRDMNTSLKGLKWVIAVLESTAIRMASEMGRVHGMVARSEYGMIGGRRFDWFARRWGDGPINEERMDSLHRAALALAFFYYFFLM
ncbi:hypothetical protein APHAL10511_005801 [Amanita phalloides]|nr:hypothetical protein APHAL10511_005801 [Amanita phalloides]